MAGKRQRQLVRLGDHPEAPQDWMPTQHEVSLLRDFIDVTVMPVAGWWIGWCPIHDKDPTHHDWASAEFNFGKGIFRCLGRETADGSRSCHEGKRGATLGNLFAVMAGRKATLVKLDDQR